MKAESTEAASGDHAARGIARCPDSVGGKRAIVAAEEAQREEREQGQGNDGPKPGVERKTAIDRDTAG